MRAGETLRRLAIAAAMLAAALAGAQPRTIFNTMRDTPISKFGKSDVDLMQKTINRALDSGEDGATVTWENPGTPNSGSVTPAKDPQGRAGCRMARVENRHASLSNSGDYIFCKNKGGAKGASWQLVGVRSGG
jgi:surface antigen